MRQTSVQRGAMPSEKDVEQWGMEKGRYIEVCRAMVASEAMCFMEKGAGEIQESDFFCEMDDNGEVIPFAGVEFKRTADTLAKGDEDLELESEGQLQSVGAESSSQEILISNKTEKRGQSPAVLIFHGGRHMKATVV